MYDLIPDNVIELVKGNLGDNAELVLNEIQETIKLESVLPPMIDKGKSYGDWGLSLLGSTRLGEYRPGDSLPLDTINQMLKSSPVRFALEMKRAQIVSVFRNKRSWKIQSPDTELVDIVTKNLIQILPKMALDFSFSSLAYGASFQELVWEYKSKYELGITDSKYQSNKKYIVAKIPNSINPETIIKINRTKDGHFDGFTQKSKALLSEEINIPRDAALIIPYDEKFRNLWGESMLKPMYPIWYWYEIVLRSMVRYMERTGTPVAVVKAPSKAWVIKPGTKQKVDGITWGMEIASNVSRSNAAVLPSDTDDQGKPLWELSYLNSNERSQPFMDILELLTQMILRAGLSADRALSQTSGGVGSYNIGEIHQQATALHNELILIQWIHYLNTYFLPLFSLYNRGKNGPPIWMETQGLDPSDRDNLATMLGAAQSMESFKAAGYRIDWETLFETNNIPLLSESDANAIKAKNEEESLAKQESMLAVQAKFNTPSPTKQSDGSLKANLPNKPAEKKLESEDETIKLYNQFHDRLGKFASSNSGFGGGFISTAFLDSSKPYFGMTIGKSSNMPNNLIDVFKSQTDKNQAISIYGKDNTKMVAIRGLEPSTMAQPNNIISAITDLAGGGIYTYTVKSMIMNNVEPGSSIHLVGVSQGGIVANNLANDKEITSNYKVKSVVTIGSPIIGKSNSGVPTKHYSISNDIVGRIKIGSTGEHVLLPGTESTIDQLNIHQYGYSKALPSKLEDENE